MAIDVGEAPPSQGGFFSNRRNILLTAAVVGGVAGLVFFMTRNRGNPPEDEAQHSAADATDLAWQNVASQLLGFRGDVSVALDKLSRQATEASEQDAAQHQDLVDRFTAESAARAVSDGKIMGELSRQAFNASWGHHETLAHMALNATQDPNRINWLTGVIHRMRANQWIQAEHFGYVPAGTYKDLTGQELPDLEDAPEIWTTPPGAGGSSLNDVVWSAWDNSRGNAYDAVSLVAAGPVRYMHRKE